jgi:hypothetical protein
VPAALAPAPLVLPPELVALPPVPLEFPPAPAAEFAPPEPPAFAPARPPVPDVAPPLDDVPPLAPRPASDSSSLDSDFELQAIQSSAINPIAPLHRRMTRWYAQFELKWSRVAIHLRVPGARHEQAVLRAPSGLDSGPARGLDRLGSPLIAP